MTPDCSHLPLWKESLALAHAVLASLEESGRKGSPPGRKACRAAVAIPSLVGEAFLEPGSRPTAEARDRAAARLKELSGALTASSLPEDDLLRLLEGVRNLEQRLTGE